MAASVTSIRNKMVSRLMKCVFIVIVFDVCLKFNVKSILNYHPLQPTLRNAAEPLCKGAVLLSKRSCLKDFRSF